MLTTFVMTVIGADRTGLVDSLARTVADQGGNWLERVRLDNLATVEHAANTSLFIATRGSTGPATAILGNYGQSVGIFAGPDWTDAGDWNEISTPAGSTALDLAWGGTGIYVVGYDGLLAYAEPGGAFAPVGDELGLGQGDTLSTVDARGGRVCAAGGGGLLVSAVPPGAWTVVATNTDTYFNGVRAEADRCVAVGGTDVVIEAVFP
jgi:hypothetical protein